MEILLWFIGGFIAGFVTAIVSLILKGRKQIKEALKQFKGEE